MAEKPSILFISIIHPRFVHYHASEYGLKKIFDLLPHKQAILALTAWLRREGCDGSYLWLDVAEAYAESGLRKIDNAICDCSPDLIGFSLTTEEIPINYRLIELVKARHPGIPIVVGGPHVSAMPVHTLEHFPAIDFIIASEGEKPLTWLLKSLHGDGAGAFDTAIPGLAYRGSDGKITFNTPGTKIGDLNELPDPAWDLIFGEGGEDARDVPFPLVCSYGCYFHCTFCSAEHGNYRYLSPKRVADQIETALREYDAEYFAIRDSFWPPNSEWLDEFLDEVEGRKLEFQFHFSTRVGALNEEQYSRLKRNGAQAVALGIEAGDQDVLKAIKKGITLDQARRTAAILNRVGIFTVAFFILGNKDETRHTVQASVDFARELNSSIAFFNILSPFPGAEVFDHVPEAERDWWIDEGPAPSMCELSPDELRRIGGEAYLKYPLRWAYLTQHALGGRLSPGFRTICRRLYVVHLKRYMLGMAERFGPARVLIRGMKSLLGK